MNEVKTKDCCLEEMAIELAEEVTNQKDLMYSFITLMSMTLEKALDAEMNYHLGYKKHSVNGINKKNSRNGYLKKQLQVMMEKWK